MRWEVGSGRERGARRRGCAEDDSIENGGEEVESGITDDCLKVDGGWERGVVGAEARPGAASSVVADDDGSSRGSGELKADVYGGGAGGREMARDMRRASKGHARDECEELGEAIHAPSALEAAALEAAAQAAIAKVLTQSWEACCVMPTRRTSARGCALHGAGVHRRMT